MHSLSALSGELAGKEDELARAGGLGGHACFRAYAAEDRNISARRARAAARAAPDHQTRSARSSASPRCSARPTERLRPAARALGRSQVALRPLAREADAAARDADPAARARGAARSCATCARRRATSPRSTPDLTRVVQACSTDFFNMAAYNPSGREGPGRADGREEGYLFWLAWVAHQSTNLFSTADAHGPFRPSLVSGSCQTFRALAQRPAAARVPAEPHAAAHEPGALRRMIKQAPQPRPDPRDGGLRAAPASAILLFLWLQFGGADPAEGRRATASRSASPRRSGCSQDVDVRAAGITIGTVRDVEVERAHAAARSRRSSSSREYAPLASDARAILRRKTLLGETFVEITTGQPRTRPKLARRRAAGRRARGGDRGARRDPPDLRPAAPGARSRSGSRSSASRSDERGESLNNALGQLPEFTESGARPARGARRAGGRGARAGPRHRRGLRGAHARTRASSPR